MSDFFLSEKSLAHLVGVHSDLVKVVKAAIDITPVDFGVLEGVRTLAREKELKHAGASETLRSRHLTGHAVDLGAYIGRHITWQPKFYKMIAASMRASAVDFNVPITWGGDWITLKDWGHFELSWKAYPI